MSPKLCRTCYFWKRRSTAIGTCWEPTQNPGMNVDPHDSCDQHKPKVIRDESVSDVSRQ
jgi:hypothetical protein